MKPRVSVIVPLFNKIRFVHRALASIASQTFGSFEAIIVDDGSTDGSAELAAAFADPRFRIIRQSNAGPGAARNRGLREAQAELSAFLDADDRWLPEYLQTAVHLLDEYGPDVAALSCAWHEVPDLRHIPVLWKQRDIPEGPVRISPETPPEHAIHMLAFMHSCTTVARTERVRQWGGFFDRNRCLYAEDAHLWLKVLLNHPVAFHSEPLVHIDTEASALSHNLRGQRPLEPFLEFPEEIEPACPPALRELLRGMLAIRAYKTACVWGYAGYWREAADLRKRFDHPAGARLPYYWPSLVCATPAGAALGAAARILDTLPYFK
jgi:hypothetical protein